MYITIDCSRNKDFLAPNVCYNGSNTAYGNSRVVTKKSSPRKMSLYANLSHKRKTKKDLKARKRAEYLATLPKHPVKRFFARLHPKRVAGYWFSRKGAMMLLKITGVVVLLGVLTVGSLFAYYRRDLNSIRPSELAKRVQTTVTKYYDRNGQLLWEDKGDGDYKQVVKSDQINNYMKEATVAIEDRDFYNHRGVSPTGLVRAAFNNASGGSTQGGSTLTQQLVKQVFFSDESQDRGLSGIPRKIKELILSIEVERMYDKDQILTLYLNESPYGGRRNGVESGAQTYFHKSAKDLTLDEAALLAAIPNQPGLYDPYGDLDEGHKALVTRQHRVLDVMQETGKITKVQADEAKAVDIISKIQPQVNSNEDIKAPHFVLEVRKQLEKELGKATVGRGGLTVKTTLDLRAQEAAEKAVATGSAMLKGYGADNLSLSSVDVKTGQVIAMMGSVGYNTPVYGQQNSATSPLEPGSSIKPIADYAPLFKQREGVNYAPGSILKDENINSIYCAGYTGGDCSLNNYTRRFYGNVPIRQALAGSLNIPAVKAMHINGVDDSLKTARDLGDASYCTDNNNAGLSAAIGGGCTVKQIEHTNAYASLARGGIYKPLAYILEVRNASNELLKKWEDPQPKQVVDPQVAYMLTSILSDAQARTITFGSQGSSYGFVVPNVWTASKTGTTENGNGQAKDSWFMNYSPVVATGVWMGNHDGRPLGSSDNSVVRRVSNDYTAAVHTQIYQPEKQWTPNQQIPRPDGLKDLTLNGRKDIYPSWFDQKTANQFVKMTFDKVSKKKATDCTPPNARIDLNVSKTTDPITKKDAFIAPDGYDASKDDDKHKCDDVKPSVTVTVAKAGANITVTANVTQGSNPLTSLKIQVGDSVVADVPVSGSGSYTTTTTVTGPQTITATVEDGALYNASGSQQYSP